MIGILSVQSGVPLKNVCHKCSTTLGSSRHYIQLLISGEAFLLLSRTRVPCKHCGVSGVGVLLFETSSAAKAFGEDMKYLLGQGKELELLGLDYEGNIVVFKSVGAEIAFAA